MNKNLIILAVVSLLSFLSTGVESEESSLSRSLRRTKRATFSEATGKKLQAIKGLIEKWGEKHALERDPGEMFNYKYHDVTARMDLQGIDQEGFERYNIQIGRKSYSSVHIEPKLNFGIGLIRASFDASKDNKAHVFLTSTSFDQIIFPNDGLQYTYKDIKRRWFGENFVVRVWSTRNIVDDLYSRFNKKLFG